MGSAHAATWGRLPVKLSRISPTHAAAQAEVQCRLVVEALLEEHMDYLVDEELNQACLNVGRLIKNVQGGDRTESAVASLEKALPKMRKSPGLSPGEDSKRSRVLKEAVLLIEMADVIAAASP